MIEDDLKKLCERFRARAEQLGKYVSENNLTLDEITGISTAEALKYCADEIEKVIGLREKSWTCIYCYKTSDRWEGHEECIKQHLAEAH